MTRYWVVDRRGPTRIARLAVVLLAFFVLVVAGCSGSSPTADEEQLANQLAERLASQGVDVDPDTLVALFGDDGGQLCIEAERGSDYIDFALISHRFALRKTTVESQDVMFAEAVIDVYCPDERAVFDEFVAGLEVEDAQ